MVQLGLTTHEKNVETRKPLKKIGSIQKIHKSKIYFNSNKMKIPFLICFLFNLSFVFTAQYTTRVTTKTVDVKKECQACYKKLSFVAMNLKWTSDCPTDWINKDRVGCLIDFLLYLSYNTLIVKNIDTWKSIHDSKCTESNSGKHLWKEIDKSFNVVTENQSYPLSKNWCSIIQSTKSSSETAYLNYRASYNLVTKWLSE